MISVALALVRRASGARAPSEAQRVHGGSDEIDNLVYACPACNRYKSAYWPAADAPEHLRLLHPGRDDLAAHIAETVSGRLVGLTARGWSRTLRLARTVADLEGVTAIRRVHVAEALIYRRQGFETEVTGSSRVSAISFSRSGSMMLTL